MSAESGPLRIGTTERTAAMKALDAHLEAGRLGVEEYADRSAIAANATLASELAELFTDLPAPHPDLTGQSSVPSVPPTKAMPAVSADAAVAERRSSFLEGWGPRVVAIMPIVAVLLFFATRQWWWFLLIPAAGALVYGGGAGRGDDHDRDRRRLDRRDRRDDR
jgi:hypothetical protein